VAGQQPGLYVWDETQRDLLAEDGMADFLLLALLVGDEDCLATGIVEVDGPARPLIEVFGAKLAAINEGQHEPVREDGAQLFH